MNGYESPDTPGDGAIPAPPEIPAEIAADPCIAAGGEMTVDEAETEIAEYRAPDGDAEETARAEIAARREALNELDAVVEKANEQAEAKQTIDEIIEAAVGVSMEAFTRRHPTTARYLIRRLGDPLEFTIKALKEDELYQQLIANTEEALDIANVIRVIVSVALSVAERLLIAL